MRRKSKLSSFFFSFFILLFLSSTVEAKKNVVVWSYYEFPPFVTSKSDGKGLSYDFVEMLNQEEGNNYRFLLKIVPRKRLNKNLADNKPGLVAWVTFITRTPPCRLPP